MKVIKFGGTSMATSDQIKKSCDIVLSDRSRKFVVVSAPGKRFSDDAKTTDLLIKCATLKILNEAYYKELEEIINRLKEIIEGLNLNINILKEIEIDLNNRLLSFNKRDEVFLDLIKAFGEDVSAKIITEYLVSLGENAKYINPGEYGLFLSDEYGNARVLQESYENLKKLKDIEGILVIPGFFGYTKNKDIITFPRGGSDITGSIVAASVDADLYENFTDVDSVFVANPNIVKDPKSIQVMTYREMRELSYAGFSVLQEETLEPIYKKRIPVLIKNTNNPSSEGTLIVRKRELNGNPVTGIACSKGFSIINIKKYLMNREIGFGRKLLEILEDEHLSYEHTPSGIDDLSVILTSDQLNDEIIERIKEKINDVLNVDDITIEHNKALAMIVGEGIMDVIGLAAKAFSSLGKNKINIEMMNQGASRVSIMIGFKEEDADTAVKALYEEFFVI